MDCVECCIDLFDYVCGEGTKHFLYDYGVKVEIWYSLASFPGRHLNKTSAK